MIALFFAMGLGHSAPVMATDKEIKMDQKDIRQLLGQLLGRSQGSGEDVDEISTDSDTCSNHL